MYGIINDTDGQNVKSTMINHLLSSIAPHYCCECGKIGTNLCDNCKYDIMSEGFALCVACGANISVQGVCGHCKVAYSRAWCVGERSGALQRLIGNYKFQNVKDNYRTLAELLLDRIAQLPPETVVVPIPTVSSHIRQRGYDHMWLIAKYVANQRGYTLSQVLERASTTKQRQASKAQRERQAKEAFCVKGSIDTAVPYLIIDDVITTGATMKYTAQLLKDNGAPEVWVAAIARQPLD